jgi:hypothetical protein
MKNLGSRPLDLSPLIELTRQELYQLRQANIPFPADLTPLSSFYSLNSFSGLASYYSSLLSKLYGEDFLYVCPSYTFMTEQANLELFNFLSSLHSKGVYWCLNTHQQDWRLRGYFLLDFQLHNDCITNYFPEEISLISFCHDIVFNLIHSLSWLKLPCLSYISYL